MAGLEAAALVDGDVHHHRAGPHLLPRRPADDRGLWTQAPLDGVRAM
ncbi:MAG TPA: hypothetical protein VFE34_18470 [Dongiaceae bacterium]|jgi:hypothetical protein|nr:hypothetical protein [Dongiaceae bacterium]